MPFVVVVVVMNVARAIQYGLIIGLQHSKLTTTIYNTALMQVYTNKAAKSKSIVVRNPILTVFE